MSPFVYNLLLFSPLLLLAAGFLYVLERLDTYRRTPPLEPPAAELPSEPETSITTTATREPHHVPTDLPQDSEFEPESEADEDAPLNEAPRRTDVAGGSAAAAAPLRTPKTRHIGLKKMRSLARRDQRRAYHEFLLSQAEARRQAEATLLEEEMEREYENARRRYLLEEEFASRRAAERAARLTEECAKKAAEAEAVQAVVTELQGRTVVRLDELAGRLGRERRWVESVVKHEGFLGVGGGGEVRMVTREGLWVNLHPDVVERFWRVVEERGKMEWAEIGEVLEGFLVAG